MGLGAICRLVRSGWLLRWIIEGDFVAGLVDGVGLVSSQVLNVTVQGLMAG